MLACPELLEGRMELDGVRVSIFPPRVIGIDIKLLDCRCSIVIPIHPIQRFAAHDTGGVSA